MPHPSGTSASTEPLREALRRQMPVAEKWAYFDHAAVAPLSGPAQAAIAAWNDQAAREGDTVWPEWSRALERTRGAAARLIGAESADVALIPSTTMGITYIAEGIDWRPGDNAVILADEFPSNVYPWLHQQDRGVETRRVPTDAGRLNLEDLRRACDGRTRVVSVSWVGYLTGHRQDLVAIGEAAHAVGALCFVDAIQGMGVLPIDAPRLPIDALAADGHKWMLGPEGAGFAWFRPGLLDRLRAVGVGWNSVEARHDFTHIDYKLRRQAARYEGGSANVVGQIGLGASLELLGAWPAADIERSILEVTDLACERLRSAGARVVSHRDPAPGGPDPRSGIVAFELPGRDPHQARERCLQAGVALSCRGGRLRLSAHAYNTPEDVDRLEAALA